MPASARLSRLHHSKSRYGAKRSCYRCPSWERRRVEVLAEQGFDYDSSIFPVKRPRYGIPDWPLTPARVQLPDGRSILEFPIASYRAWGKNWPVGGGGYHRLLPGMAGSKR